jgi:ABC-2 type transport system permease protein
MTGPAAPPPALPVAQPAPADAVTETVLVLLRSARLQSREFFRRPLAVVFAVIQPGALAFLAILVAPGQDQALVALRVTGMALLAIWASAIWSAGLMLAQDRSEGTLATVLLATRRPLTVLIGRSLGAAGVGAGAVAATSAVVLAALGQFGTGTTRALLLLLAPAVLSSTAMGTLVAAVFIGSRSAPRIAEALLYPVFVGSGVVLPLSRFPAWVGAVAHLVPLYWVSRVFRGALAGAFPGTAVLALVFISAGYALLGGWVFHRAVVRSRVRGDLDFF